MRRAANGGFINATDCADYLAKKGMPFREAYGIVGQLVGHCMDTGHYPGDPAPGGVSKGLSPYFQADVYDALYLRNLCGTDAQGLRWPGSGGSRKSKWNTSSSLSRSVKHETRDFHRRTGGHHRPADL